jgi:hypothetical protein
MMCGGSVDKVGGKGVEGDDFLMMQIIASYDHGSRHHHTAATGPHSWQQSIQQSTNILCNNNYYLSKNHAIDRHRL